MPLDNVSNGDVHVLHYNVSWIYSAFRSRAAAETLLSPERESGNLTSRDYDDAIQFLPGPHRHYPIIGLTAGIAIGFGLRPRLPRMSRLQQLSFLSFTSVVGHLIGVMRQITVHLNYLHDIENPDGYKRAMENVQKILPIHHRRSVVLTRDYQISPDAFPQATSEHDSPSSSTEKSKWDQIRAANSRTAQGSTWDALRQQHEKVRIKPNPQDRGDDKWISEKF